MSDPTIHAPPKEVKKDDHSQAEDVWTELRNLLLGPEQVRLAKLQERLDNPRLHAKEVSRVLPEAIMLRASRDKQIAKALEPTIEETIKASVRKDPKSLGDALFPVMGPAIRKAISSAIFGMIQSFNQVIEQSFSIQGLKWRIEALKTRKPFAEVVLVHTLVYHVEQVFLIHRNTGLMLQHVVSKEVTAQDPDLVSGMLTAIQDFAEDSFGLGKGESLEALRIGGNRSVWVERGPQAILAVVIRGTPPVDYRLFLHDALDAIHLKQSDALDSFDGDNTPFEAIKSDLEVCLQSQFKGEEQKTSPLLWILLGTAILFIGIWSYQWLRDDKRWAHYVERLRDEPGIVVTATEKRSGKYYIFGLRDPLAADPMEILKEARLDPEEVTCRWEAYQALYPKFILIRAKQMLQPPETVSLNFKDGILYAAGDAPHKWIVEIVKIVRAIPGIVQFQGDDLVGIDPGDIETTREQIQKEAILFRFNEAKIVPDQENALDDLISDIKKLLSLARILGKWARIEIVGHTDSIGSDEKNIGLSQKRADTVMSVLVSKGLKKEIFTAIGIGSKEPLKQEITEQDRTLNRSVTFQVVLGDNPD